MDDDLKLKFIRNGRKFVMPRGRYQVLVVLAIISNDSNPC